MATLRVFVSSTYYDLKHLRSSLEHFIESFGFEAILSEKGRIAYAPDIPLDESCYREVDNSDIFILIVGGRYGSEASGEKPVSTAQFYQRYNSITRGEYEAAAHGGIPTYVLIERSVYSEYDTYRHNRTNPTVAYAHVDSVNIFELIGDVLAQPRNNPVFQFDKYTEIEAWLRAQWAGTFRELLHRLKEGSQLASLQSQVMQLSELQKTMRLYLEEIISKVSPKDSAVLIRGESERLREIEAVATLANNNLAKYLRERYGITSDQVVAAAVAASSVEDFAVAVAKTDRTGALEYRLRNWATDFRAGNLLDDINAFRASVGAAPLPADGRAIMGTTSQRSPIRTKRPPGTGGTA